MTPRTRTGWVGWTCRRPPGRACRRFSFSFEIQIGALPSRPEKIARLYEPGRLPPAQLRLDGLGVLRAYRRRRLIATCETKLRLGQRYIVTLARNGQKCALTAAQDLPPPPRQEATGVPARLVKKRLEYLRRELRAERISYEELAELQGLAPHIAADDVELLEAAGVPESRAKRRRRP